MMRPPIAKMKSAINTVKEKVKTGGVVGALQAGAPSSRQSHLADLVWRHTRSRTMRSGNITRH